MCVLPWQQPVVFTGVQHFGIEVQEWSWWLHFFLRTVEKPTLHSLEESFFKYSMISWTVKVSTWCTLGCWSPGLVAAQDQTPSSCETLGNVQLHMLKSFWCQLSLTAHCLSTSASWDKDTERVGGLQKKGVLLEGKLISCVWCNWEHGTETVSSPQIHDLTSFFWVLVAFRGSCLWVEVICKGLWSVCDNALTSCVSSLLCFPLVTAFPPPLALHCYSPSRMRVFSPALTKIQTKAAWGFDEISLLQATISST